MPSLVKVINSKGVHWCMRYDLAPKGGKRRQSKMSIPATTEVEARAFVEYINSKRRSAQEQARLAKIVEGTSRLSKTEHGADSWAADRWNTLNFREKQAVLFVKFRGRCHYCGVNVFIPMTRPNTRKGFEKRAVMDHIVPVAAGGSNRFENMALACQDCNEEKSDGELQRIELLHAP